MITKKEILFEFFWLMAIVLLAIGALLLLNNYFAGLFADVNINNHDTYFVISEGFIRIFYFSEAFLLFAFLTYLIKEGTKKYKQIPGNIVLLLASVGILIQQIGIIIFGNLFLAPQRQSKGWTVYPPLSAIETPLPSKNNYSPEFWLDIHQYVFTPIILLIIIFISIKTGRLVQSKKQDNS